MSKEIAVCRNCGKPLISTCMSNKCEYYCLNCGSGYGILDAKIVEATKELRYTKSVYYHIFKSLYKYIIPYGCYKNNCKKCKDMTECHSEHMTEKEVIQEKVAWELLRKIENNE